MLLTSTQCNRHGDLPHTATHEAGHATAAVLLDIEFSHVMIAPSADTQAAIRMHGEAAAGGIVMLTDQPTEWVAPREVDALTFLMAGSVAETMLLGHHLAAGFRGDLWMFRVGTRRLAPMHRSEIGILNDGRARAHELLTENVDAVRRVRDLLSSHVPRDDSGRFLVFDAPLIIPYHDVRDAVLSSDERTV